MSLIKVKFDTVFYFDAEGYDPEFIDVEGLAKDSAFRDLKSQIVDGSITADDFSIIKTPVIEDELKKNIEKNIIIESIKEALKNADDFEDINE